LRGTVYLVLFSFCGFELGNDTSEVWHVP